MDTAVYSLYQHTTPAGKVYIGITGRPPEERWNNGNGYRNNRYFWNAIKKYGWKNILHEVLLTGLLKEEAEELEQELISCVDSTNPEHGYNLDLGGSAIGKVSDETKRKMADASRLHWEDPSYREKVVAALKKRTFSAEHRAALAESRRGKKHTPSTLKKISEMTKGKNLGASNPNARAVVCVETGTVFATTKEAANSVGVSHGAISMACSGRRKTAGGQHWRYA